MNHHSLKRAALTLALLSVGAGGGYWFATARQLNMLETPAIPIPSSSKPNAEDRKVLYWYDPMLPQHHFDKPGKSPFMDMELVPQYADEQGENTSVKISPSVSQNLGMRLAKVSRENLANTVNAVGVITFNERDVAIVQARTGGFVERVYDRAPGDVIPAGAPLVDLLVPEWAGLQEEFLALQRSGEASLIEAARQRLRLAGMPAALISKIEKTRKSHAVSTIITHTGGVIQQLDVRAGMTVMAGQTLARINGIETVWLDVAVPETQAADIRSGQRVEAHLTAFPGKKITGRITSVLPEANLESRTLKVRIELPNKEGELKPGMTAQVVVTESASQPMLFVPSEAVIRTGQRALIMVAEEGGRYRPVNIDIGKEVNGKTAVLNGLEEGQQVVASGQFLIDSEASLKGITARAENEVPGEILHESEGRILELNAKEVTLAHGPFKTLGMPGMTMAFPLARPELGQGFKTGDQVHVSVKQTDDGLVIARMRKMGDTK